MDLIFSEFEEIDLESLFQAVIADYQDAADEMGVEFQIEVDSRPVVILGDYKSIDRTFRALVDNAIKFSLEGGKVAVRIWKQGSNAVISISDQGIGIQPEDLPRIYDRFWRTEEYEGHLFAGIGLGLSIAKQVVWQHGGTIDVESTPKNGSTFTVKLPEKYVMASKG